MQAATVQLDERVLHDEYLPVDDFDFDLIVSIGQLHLINDVPGMLSQLKQRLRPDGLLLACVPGANTIANIRECWISAEAEITGGLSSRFLPLFDVRTAGSLLQRTGYSLPVTDIDEVSVSYRDTRQIFADLRSMAATNVLVGGQGHAVTRKLWEKFNQKLTARRDSHGKLPASYELIWMSGWAPSPTQQKPLKPGSAEISLADVLKGLE
ncbi:MAG: methyltransferase domain-containing protein [Pseudomonadota bacterium]